MNQTPLPAGGQHAVTLNTLLDLWIALSLCLLYWPSYRVFCLCPCSRTATPASCVLPGRGTSTKSWSSWRVEWTSAPVTRYFPGKTSRAVQCFIQRPLDILTHSCLDLLHTLCSMNLYYWWVRHVVRTCWTFALKNTKTKTIATNPMVKGSRGFSISYASHKCVSIFYIVSRWPLGWIHQSRLHRDAKLRM